MSKTKIFLKIGIFLAIVLCAFSFCFIKGKHTEPAWATLREKNIEIIQENEIYYIGENYLTSERLKNQFLSAFSITIEGEKIPSNTEKISITCDSAIQNPGKYSCNFIIQYENNEYSVNDFSVLISKKIVMVTTYMNGKTNLTINEGENINFAYDYAGAIEGDYSFEEINGVTIKTLHSDKINTVAYVAYVPTDVVKNYTVAASNATSDYYDFSYVKSLLTIQSVAVPQLTISDGETVSVYLLGSFSQASELQFVDIGTSFTSPDYMDIKKNIEKIYAGTSLTSDYEDIGCYSINVLVNGQKAENVNSNTLILLNDKMSNKKEYKVIALYNNGDTELLNATIVNGYLSFNPKDGGDFLIVCPVEGIKTSTYIIIISIGIAFVLLVIFLVALFRKKY